MGAAEIFLLILFGGLFAALLAGIPAIFAIAGAPLIVSGIAIGLGFFDPIFLTAFPQRIFGLMTNPLFVAIPLFIFMGILLEKSGLAARLLHALHSMGGQSPRGLALWVLVISVLIGAASGVIGATIIMLGMISYPALMKVGIDKKFASGLVLSAGTLGQIIPPSIVLIILADQISNASLEAQRRAGEFAVNPITVSDLFAAALVPGLLLALVYAVYVWIKLSPIKTSHPIKTSQSPIPGANEDFEKKQKLWVLAMPLVLIFLVLGSIVLGIATPSEAASLGAGGMALFTFFSGHNDGAENKLKLFSKAIEETVILSGVIFAIVFAASFLSLVFRGFGGDEILAHIAQNLPGEKWTALALVMVLVFLLGFILEFVEIIFLVIPIAGPILFAMGIEPVWFAILLALNLQTSFLTPPFGIALFYFKSVVPQSTTTSQIYHAVVPFVVLQLLTLCIVALFPDLVHFLPNLLFQ